WQYLPATLQRRAGVPTAAFPRRPRSAAQRNRHRRRPRAPPARPVHGLAAGLRSAATKTARRRQRFADTLATQCLAEKKLRAVLPRPRHPQEPSRTTGRALVCTGAARMAAFGRSPQPGTVTRPVPPPAGALAAAGPRTSTRRKRLQSTARHLLPERTHPT